MPEAFKEDFFERVTDVKWLEEKKVYWMAGDNFSATGNVFSKIYTSDDGMHWSSSPTTEDPGKVSGSNCGLWMRTGLQPEGKPLWLIGGSGIRQDGRVLGSCLQYGDGQSLGEMRFFDARHYGTLFGIDYTFDGDGVFVGLGAAFQSMAFSHFDVFTSASGMDWSPERYHEDNGINPIIMPASSRGVQRVTKFQGPEDSVAVILSLEGAPPIPTPRDIIPVNLAFNNDIYQMSNLNTAVGSLRKGKNAGRKVKIRLGKGGKDWFGSSCTISDAKTGKKIGSSDCGIQHAHSICYGYYVFVVAGGNGGDGKGGSGYSMEASSCLSYTEDGIEWQVLDMGNPAHEMWALVCGPRE